MTEAELVNFNVMHIADDASTGYVFDVDLDYPVELHDLHDDYPLAPERLEITEEMLSDYNKNVLEKISNNGSKRPPN